MCDLFAAAFHARLSRGLRRISKRTSRVEATNDIYGCTYEESSLVRTSVACYRMHSLMSRWLPRDLTNTPLGEIDAEIASIHEKPMRDRTVTDTERLADLRDARRRIAGSSRGCG